MVFIHTKIKFYILAFYQETAKLTYSNNLFEYFFISFIRLRRFIFIPNLVIYIYIYISYIYMEAIWASLIAQLVKNLPAM